MRIVYLGTSDFAVAVLERLLASDHEVPLVVTRPDRPKGRGRRTLPPPVAEFATREGLDLHQPPDLHSDESLEAIAAARPDALVVCAYGALVKESLLDAYEILNVHPSLLPRWRGAAPIERALMAGDEETGVAIMRLTAGLDEGPVCLMERVGVDPADDFGSLSQRLAALGGELLVRALDERPEFAEQGEVGLTYAEKITAADRDLDADADPAQLERTVRALRPHIGARIALEGTDRLGVWDARVAGGSGPLRAEGDRLRFGGLELLEVQPPGGRRMSAADYLRGHRP